MKNKDKLFSCVALLGLCCAGIASADPGPVPNSAERIQMIQSGTATSAAYIVFLNEPPVARYTGGIAGLAATSPSVTGASKLDISTSEAQAYLAHLEQSQLDMKTSLDAALGRDVAVIAAYRVVLNGFAVWLDKSEAAAVAALPGVSYIEAEQVQRINTDAGPQWIGATAIWDGTGTYDANGNFAEGLIAGVIDSGVNSDSPSFAATGPVDGYVHINPRNDGNPTTPDYFGACDGTTGLPYCNDKLIGAYDCTTSAGGIISLNSAPAATSGGKSNTRAPVLTPISGSYPTAACGPLHPVEVPADQTSLTWTVVGGDPVLLDLTAHILYDDPVLGPVEVASGDVLGSPETATYTPTGGVFEGTYFAQACAYQNTGGDTYTGVFTYDDTPISGVPQPGPIGCNRGSSPEDANGHGSHTASTTAGNLVDATVEAPTISVPAQVSGVARHANLITYLGCVPTGNCVTVNTNAAIEQATIDMVDVINFSIGGGPGNPWSDSNAQAYLSSRAAGIWVATSASNDGPGPGTIGSPANAPWITTVAAATHDREFGNALVNMTGGNTAAPADISGKAVTGPLPATTIVYAGDYPADSPTVDPAQCGFTDPADNGAASSPPWSNPTTFNGEIVVCDRGGFARVDKCRNVMLAGAGGCILANDAGNGNSLVADPHEIPSVHISHADGVILKAWLASGTGHTGEITTASATLDSLKGDIVAGFSSRGPNAQTEGGNSGVAIDIVKPDVANPGVDILAAVHTVGNTSPTTPEYSFISGTSMSSPHTAGSLALVRSNHPTWTATEGQSALMLTAKTAMLSHTGDPADPFDMGSGRVDLNVAAKSGLVMDETIAGFANAEPAAGGSPRTLNLPNMGENACNSTCSWLRLLESPADLPHTVQWTITSQSESAGWNVTVTPSSFTLAPGETQLLDIEIDVADVSGVDHPFNWIFGQLTLTPDVADVPEAHMMIAVINTGDIDGDGVLDRNDNCPRDPNADQADGNSNGIGDVCEGSDTDGDGIADDSDNCPLIANFTQEDADGDTVGDVCDNCMMVANTDQCNTNGNGTGVGMDNFGNVCDADLDNNGITNSFDLSIMRNNFGATGINDSDLDCNGIVNSFDLTIMRDRFGQAPGPSGIAP